jgi:hypothetical protein
LNREHNETARAVGANLGLFAVGRKLVFVEGRESSVDRLTYHKVLQSVRFDAFLLPMGSVRNINALRDVADELRKAIFGVDLFMIRDRDGLTAEQVAELEENPRFRVLPRRHVENWFLDPAVLSLVATHLYLSAEKADEQAIREELLRHATACVGSAVVHDVKEFLRLGFGVDAPKVRDPEHLDLDALVGALVPQIRSQVKAASLAVSDTAVEARIRLTHRRFERSLVDGAWTIELPGKAIFARFCGSFWNEDVERVRRLYVDTALRERPEAFQEIRAIFEHFARQ